MNLLLDTHILLWAAADHPAMSRAARDLIEDTGNTLWFSAASLWEVAIKRALDRPDFRTDPGVLRTGLLQNDYRELAVEGAHCLTLAALPRHHNDPFDRMLLAQALAEGFALVTADAQLARYDGPVVPV
ncbi:type II toxin-antitoxin system VapC family toxin [Roseivivax sp. CAU 1761]